MKNIITLIESELHRRALTAISEEKQAVAAKAFDVPELHEDGDDDNIGEEAEPEGSKEFQKKNVEGKRATKGEKEPAESSDEDVLVDEEESKEIQGQNVQGKRRESQVTR